jgi:hypothetical protein
VLDELQATSKNAALIVVSGTGGVGKSVAIAQWLSYRAETREHYGDAFGAIEFADRVTGTTVRSAFRRWVGIASGLNVWPGHDDDVGRVMTRCAIAHAAVEGPPSVRGWNYDLSPPDSGPYYTLALDGIDEGSEAVAENLREILRWFSAEHRRIAGHPAERPRAVLVVTCRRSTDLDRVLLPTGRGVPPPAGSYYVSVKATDFTHGELVEVALLCDEAIATRLATTFAVLIPSRSVVRAGARSLRLSTSLGGGANDRAVVARDVTGERAASADIAEALRHPAMWDRFAALSPAQRHLVLDGDSSALDLLSQGFVEWAVAKCCRSIGARSIDTPGMVNHLLRTSRLAMECAKTDKDFTRSLWGEGIDASQPHSRATVLDVDLERGGVIIQGEGDTWTWRHGFVGRWLASDSAGECLREWSHEQV